MMARNNSSLPENKSVAKTTDKGRAKKSNNRSRNRKAGSQKNNFQDKFAKREEQKGERLAAIDKDVWLNDPEWYVPNDTLLENVARVSTNLSAGLPIPLGAQAFTPQQPASGTGVWKYSVSPAPKVQHNPGILVLNTLHTVGAASLNTDPINQASNKLYTYQQMKSGKSPRYEAPENMMYYIALADAYAYYVWLVRLYGIANDFQALNRYTPQYLYQAMGVNYADVKRKLAQFRTGINLFAHQLSAFPLPKTIRYIHRRMFLYEHVFRDADSQQAQYILFNPVGFYHWVEGDTQHPTTYLTLDNDMLRSSSTLKTVDQLLDYADELLAPLQASEDVRQIGSDILNVYGAGDLMQIMPIAETYAISPVYNREIMTQIENSHILPLASLTANTCVKIEQATGINQSYLTASYSYLADLRYTGIASDSRTKTNGLVCDILNSVRDNEYLLNFHDPNPDAKMVMEATRLTMAPYVATTEPAGTVGATINLGLQTVADSGLPPTYFGPELILGAQVIIMGSGTSSTPVGISTDVFSTERFYWNYGSDSWHSIIGGMVGLSILSAFDWCPKYRYSQLVTAGTTTTSNLAMVPGEYFLDEDIMALISHEELNRMNEVAWYGMFEPRIVPTR